MFPSYIRYVYGLFVYIAVYFSKVRRKNRFQRNWEPLERQYSKVFYPIIRMNVKLRRTLAKEGNLGRQEFYAKLYQIPC